MGWKRVKEQYEIRHIIQVTDKGICIGSSFIKDIIVISLKGQIIKRYSDGRDEELMRYQREMDADPGLLELLTRLPDQFSKSIRVYTHDKGEIVEKQCEALGWPNTTHDGTLMYENSFSPDLQTVIRKAEQHIAAATAHLEIRITDTEEMLAELRCRLNTAIEKQTSLQSLYSMNLQD